MKLEIMRYWWKLVETSSKVSRFKIEDQIYGLAVDFISVPSLNILL